MIEKNRLIGLIDAAFPAQVKFLAELVRVPSDNPPGDCAPHAQRTAHDARTTWYWGAVRCDHGFNQCT